MGPDSAALKALPAALAHGQGEGRGGKLSPQCNYSEAGEHGPFSTTT